MSEATVTKDAETLEKVDEYKKLDPMSQEDFHQVEREIQLGIRDTLPDGRSIKDVQKSLEETQLAQEKERREKYLPKTEKSEADEKLEVLIAGNGVMSARPEKPVVGTEAAISGGGGDDDSEPESDLPKDLAGRDKLIAHGITTLEQLAALKHEDLVNVPGIKDVTAEKILAYGKSGE